jgi:hypothetical protein
MKKQRNIFIAMNKLKDDVELFYTPDAMRCTMLSEVRAT